MTAAMPGSLLLCGVQTASLLQDAELLLPSVGTNALSEVL